MSLDGIASRARVDLRDVVFVLGFTLDVGKPIRASEASGRSRLVL